MFTLQKNFNLQSLSTFHLPAKAAFYGELTDEKQLPEICALPEFNVQTVLWLGGGSNILFVDDFPYLIIKLANKGIREITRENGKVWVQAAAGEVWHDFVQHTLSLGLSGLENLSLIPGTVGASPVQNIGAYGVEVKDRIHSVRCFDLEKQEFIEFSNAECAFAYRDSFFKHAGKKRYVIVAVTFVLDEVFVANVRYGDVAQVLAKEVIGRDIRAQDVANAICAIRRSKLPNPDEIGNVGSFYHNPIVSAQQAAALLQAFPDMPHYPQEDGRVKLAAGWLIDQCGLKSKSIGGAAVHEKQALVLINQNQASAEDLMALSDYVVQTVQQRFAVQLQAEPSWLPETPFSTHF